MYMYYVNSSYNVELLWYRITDEFAFTVSLFSFYYNRVASCDHHVSNNWWSMQLVCGSDVIKIATFLKTRQWWEICDWLRIAPFKYQANLRGEKWQELEYGNFWLDGRSEMELEARILKGYWTSDTGQHKWSGLWDERFEQAFWR